MDLKNSRNEEEGNKRIVLKCPPFLKRISFNLTLLDGKIVVLKAFV